MYFHSSLFLLSFLLCQRIVFVQGMTHSPVLELLFSDDLSSDLTDNRPAQEDDVKWQIIDAMIENASAAANAVHPPIKTSIEASTSDEPKPEKRDQKSLEEELLTYSELKVVPHVVPVPFTPPENPNELPLFLPVRKRQLCWKCGHRGTCTRPQLFFCSRCGHIGRLSKTCRACFQRKRGKLFLLQG